MVAGNDRRSASSCGGGVVHRVGRADDEQGNVRRTDGDLETLFARVGNAIERQKFQSAMTGALKALSDGRLDEAGALLEQAALATRDILDNPAPYVLQTSLDDYYVSYELNACTHAPERMAAIYSELHQNIQDWFNEAGVEIMSPAYNAYRDGGELTIPAQYRRPGLQPPKPAAPVFPPRPKVKGGVDTLPLNRHGIKTRPL